jgi:hypothetical protein
VVIAAAAGEATSSAADAARIHEMRAIAPPATDRPVARE